MPRNRSLIESALSQASKPMRAKLALPHITKIGVVRPRRADTDEHSIAPSMATTAVNATSFPISEESRWMPTALFTQPAHTAHDQWI